MNKTKIEWCDTVWNPVWGCLNHCFYCYAKQIAKRFASNIEKKEREFCLKNNIRYSDISKDLEEFKPVFLESNFNKKFPKKPSRIFVNSMSDIAFWDRDWMLRVFGKIVDNPQHQFLFLTKEPEIYRKFGFAKNCLLGVTVNKQKDVERIKSLRFKKYIDGNNIFVSFEPLLENMTEIGIEKYDTATIEEKLEVLGILEKEILYLDLKDVDWIIIGGMTGKKPFYPPEEWIQVIIRKADNLKIPVFEKDNLRKIWNKAPRREFSNDL